MTDQSPGYAAPVVAPPWHTALLVVLLLAVAVSGTLLQHYGGPRLADRVVLGPAMPGVFTQYLAMLTVNWGLLIYVSRLFRVRSVLADLLGRRWKNAARASADLGLALALCVLIEALQQLMGRLCGAGRNAAIAALLPATSVERLLWILVATSVGFCEEVVYRGYFQTQFTAFSGRSSIAIALQAALFGVAHAEQGAAAALAVAGYGLLFGVLARARSSLLPGIVSHVAIDLASGLLR